MDSDILLSCQRLFYQQEVAKWSLEKAEQFDKAGADRTKLLHRLLSHSLLHSVSSLLDSIPEDELLELLGKFPRADDDESLAKDRDLVIYHGYLVLRGVLRLLKQSASCPVDEGVLASVAREVAAHLRQTSPLPFRLELLENLFSLLFLVQQDFSSLHAASTDNAKPSSSSSPSPSTAFVATPAIFHAVLTLVQDSLLGLAGSQLSPKPSSSPSPAPQGTTLTVSTTISDREFQFRLDRLRQVVSEALWRLDIFRQDAGGDSQLISKVVASPTTLLSLCLRVRNYPRCYEIIKFFSLEEFVKHEVLLSETLHTIQQKLKSGAAAAVNLDHLPSAEALETVAVCIDFAITCTSTEAVAKKFLDHATKLLDVFSRQKEADQSRHYWKFALYKNLIRKCHLLLAKGGLANLREALASPEVFPSDLDLLEQALGRQVSLSEAVREVCTLSDKLFGPTPGDDRAKKTRGAVPITSIKATLEKASAIFSAASVPAPSSPQNPLETLYLRSFISYLLYLIDSLLRRDFGVPKEQILAEVLAEGPTKTLAHFVFERKQYKIAEQLAPVLKMDLLSVTIRCCTPQTSSLSSAPPLPGDTSSGVDPSLPIAWRLTPETAKVIMNGKVAFEGVARNAVVVAQSLLARMGALIIGQQHDLAFVELDSPTLTLIRSQRGFKDAVSALAELQAVSLGTLSLPAQTCFLLNLHNLMLLHAFIEAEAPPPTTLEDLALLRARCQYLVGELGVVSAEAVGQMARELALMQDSPFVSIKEWTSVGLSWGSRSSPPLTIYTEEGLQVQLAQNLGRWLSQTVALRDSVIVAPSLLPILAQLNTSEDLTDLAAEMVKSTGQDLTWRKELEGVLVNNQPTLSERLKFTAFDWTPVYPMAVPQIIELGKKVEELDQGRPEGDTQGATAAVARREHLQYPLTDEVITFIESKSAIFAALTCLVHPPLSTFDSGTTFLDYALSQSKSYPVLQRMIEHRFQLLRGPSRPTAGEKVSLTKVPSYNTLQKVSDPPQPASDLSNPLFLSLSLSHTHTLIFFYYSSEFYQQGYLEEGNSKAGPCDDRGDGRGE